MTLKKEVYVEKRGYEGKNRAEVEIREKNVQGGFYGSSTLPQTTKNKT
jgi:hypothetical protein